MIENGFEQRPALDGSSSLYDNEFLVPFSPASAEDSADDQIGNRAAMMVVSAIVVILVILIVLL